MSLVDALPTDPNTDSLYDAFTDWTARQGLSLYAHQEEADTRCSGAGPLSAVEPPLRALPRALIGGLRAASGPPDHSSSVSADRDAL